MNATLNHTPGPWLVRPRFGSDFVGFEIVAGPIDQEVDLAMVPMETLLGQEPTVEANARLIAAAPELLAATKRARSWLGTQKPDTETLDLYQQLTAAIAKATGTGSGKD